MTDTVPQGRSLTPDSFQRNPRSAVDVETKLPDVAMSKGDYAHVKKLIQKEINAGFDSSGWFALGLASLSIAIGIGVTLLGTEITNASHKGKLELAAYFFAAFGAFCIAMHLFGRRRTANQRATELIETMDRYNMNVHRRESASERVGAPDGSAPDESTHRSPAGAPQDSPSNQAQRPRMDDE
jgi:hypothetical protein